MDEQPIVSAEIRAALPPLVGAYVAFLEARIAGLQERVDRLPAELVEAQARALQHSGNSSRPPSSDPCGARSQLKHKPSGRKRAGQKGHPGHARIQLAADQITARVAHRPTQCPGCTLPLDAALPGEGEPTCVQVWEIPPITADVTEHRGYQVRCPHYGVLVPAPDLPEGAFGPRLTAMSSLLHGRFRLSMRETTAVFADLFGVPLGPGRGAGCGSRSPSSARSSSWRRSSPSPPPVASSTATSRLTSPTPSLLTAPINPLPQSCWPHER